MDIKHTNRENLNTNRGKPTFQVPKTKIGKRPALGELSNKIRGQDTASNAGANKKTSVKVAPTQLVTKKTSLTTHPTVVTSTTTVLNKKCTVPKKKDDKVNVLKRQESIISKIHCQIPKSIPELQCKNENKIDTICTPPSDVIDIDINDRHDPFLVSEYVQDIYNYLQKMEEQYPITQHFLSNGHRSTPRMRSVLVAWLVEVHLNFKFIPETLQLTVAILDRYLQNSRNVGRETLQLVGLGAMFIATKYEEMYYPDLTDFVYICDDTFNKKQILEMERNILSKLEFNIGRPLPLRFLRRFNRIANVLPEHHALGKYMLDLILIEYELCHLNPSLQAAAACCLSIAIVNGLIDPSQAWSKKLVYYSSYKYSDIKHTITHIACVINRAETSQYKVIREKYASSKFYKISLSPKLKGPLVKKLLTVVADTKTKV